MRKKEKDEYSVKFYKSPFMIIGLIVLIISAYSISAFVILDIIINEKARIQFVESPFLCVFCIVFLFVIPTILFIILMPRGFTKIVINKNGIETSLFRIFRKKNWKWEEIQEIFCGFRIIPWLFLSKRSNAFDDRTYEKLIKDKDLMQIEMTSKKVYRAIRHYWDKPIIGITEEIEKQLKLL